MSKKETFKLDFSLIDKWKAEDNEKYLEEWLQSDWAYNTAVRIARQRHLFVYREMRDQVTKVDGDYINPELVSYVYLGMRHCAPSWEVDGGRSFYGYLIHGAPPYADFLMNMDEPKAIVSTLDGAKEDGSSTNYLDTIITTNDEYDHRSPQFTLGKIVQFAVENIKPTPLRYYLHYINGTSPTEIARMFGKSQAGISASISRTNSLVREKLKDKWLEGNI